MPNSPYILVTAADKRFAWQALNLVGSVLAKSDIFAGIYVYDLGMTATQRRLFDDIPRVEIRDVEHFVPYWQACWSWKPWVWVDAPGDRVLYLDAGTEVLTSLQPALDMIEANDYFVVSQYESMDHGHTLADIIPSNYYKQFDVDPKLSDKPVVAGGLVGFKRDSKFYREVITETLELVRQGYNLGWSQVEMNHNKAPHYLPDAPLRDCKYFRQDQTLLNMLLYKMTTSPVVAPFGQYSGTGLKPANDQIIWLTRRLSALRYIDKIPYTVDAEKRNKSNRRRRVIKNASPRSGYFKLKKAVKTRVRRAK